MVDRASAPPPSNRQIAIIELDVTQNTFCFVGEVALPPLVIVSTTIAPESADVTKKMTVKIKEVTAMTDANGSSAYISYRANDASVIPLTKAPWLFAIISNAAPPITENQMPIKMIGAINTAKKNSRTVLPLEIFAMKIPTKGDQLTHHAQ